jgi:polyisoprenyl-phosphate glycosyltransferase
MFVMNPLSQYYCSIPAGKQNLKSNPDGMCSTVSLVYYTSLPHKREVNETSLRPLYSFFLNVILDSVTHSCRASGPKSPVGDNLLIADQTADKTLVSIVAPIYNEESNVTNLVHRIREVFEQLSVDWELVFALDPCTDRTEDKILELIEAGLPIRLVKFSRRFGKPVSLLAGLRHCMGDAIIVIDSDLQDPPELMATMIEKWREGNLVVIAQRTSRRGENFIYLKSAELFYWILEKFSEVKIPRNTGDFRLLDRRVVQEIRRINERHGFLRGLTSIVGFKTSIIPFDRDSRLSGKTQISILGACGIALDGIVPFSKAPIRFVLALGLGILLIGLFSLFLWTIGILISGVGANWLIQSLFIMTWIFFGLTIFSLGVVGEYVLRCYEDSRDRPLYVVDSIVEAKELSRKLSTGQIQPPQ